MTDETKTVCRVPDAARNTIDLVRGIAIFLMLWGHCIQYCDVTLGGGFFQNLAFRAIYSFHMPCLMLVSGYLFFFSLERRSLGGILSHRIRALGQPIVCCSVFAFLITDLPFSLLRGDASSLAAEFLNSFSSLWFLWSVLGAVLVTALTEKAPLHPSVKAVCFLLGALVVACLPNSQLNLFLYPYFLLGYFFAKVQPRLPGALLRLRWLSLPAWGVFLFFWKTEHYVYTTGVWGSSLSFGEQLGVDLFRFFGGLFGSVALISLVSAFCRRILPRIGQRAPVRAVAAMGRQSLEFYALSVPLLSGYLPLFVSRVLPLVGVTLTAESEAVYDLLIALPVALFYAALLGGLTRLLKKSRLGAWLFGR